MEDLIQKDRENIWHPYSQQWEMIDPIGIVSGKGSLLIDFQGREIIDAISSWWVTIHGHANPYIAKKIYEQALQLEQVIFAGFTHQPAIDLAERLLAILPGEMKKIFYSDNGSTAVEVALKMAVQYWRNLSADVTPVRKKILALKHSYHGDTFGAMSVSERGVFTLAFQDFLFDVGFIETPTAENINALLNDIELYGDEIACFIYEPLVQGAGGMLMTEPSFLDLLLKKIKSKKIISIADEVMTGFGRTGKLFASEYMQTSPDIICLSKGLTGGTMAMGVTACTKEIHAAYISSDKTKIFFHGHSFTANPIACAAALASLDILLNENCITKIEKITRLHESFAERLRLSEMYELNKIHSIRTCGTILAFEMQTAQGNYLNAVGKQFAAAALEKNVLLRPLGNTVYVMPPYCITESELAKIYDSIEEIFSSLDL